MSDRLSDFNCIAGFASNAIYMDIFSGILVSSPRLWYHPLSVPWAMFMRNLPNARTIPLPGLVPGTRSGLWAYDYLRRRI